MFHATTTSRPVPSRPSALSMSPSGSRPDHCVVLKGAGPVAAPSASTPTSAAKERRPRGSFGATERAPVRAWCTTVQQCILSYGLLLMLNSAWYRWYDGPRTRVGRMVYLPESRSTRKYYENDRLVPLLCRYISVPLVT